MPSEFSINKQQAAYMLDVDERTLTKYQNNKDDPLPIKVKGKRGQANSYDPAEIIKWKLRKELSKLSLSGSGEIIDGDAEKARLTREQADGQALKNAITRKEVAPIELLEWSLSNLGGQIKSILESIPLKVKKRLPQLKAADIEIVKREIVKAQNAASKCELDFTGFEGSN